MIIKAWGVLAHTPLVLSNAMKRLNVEHYIMACTGPNCQYNYVSNDGSDQPALPVILQSLDEIARVEHYIDCNRIILFVFDSKAAISNSNLDIWSPITDLDLELRSILTKEDKEPFELRRTVLTAMDYINLASKPSLLSELQTLWCKVNPYDLRKKIRQAIIRYLCADLSKNRLRLELSHANNGSDIYNLLMQNPNLRLAVEHARLTTPNQASMKFDMDVFDINYILKSWNKP